MLPELIPVYEEWSAAKFNSYSPTEWRKLDHPERVQAVAFYRVSRLVDLHTETAVSEYMKRQNKRRR